MFRLFPIIFFVSSCTSLRDSPLFTIDYSDQSPRLLMDVTCNDERWLAQGLVGCETKNPSDMSINVKVPPTEGRVTYSNGEVKKTEDFNWYPEEGFFIWKKKPIRDTWVALDVTQLFSAYGENPFSVEVAGVHKDIGVIATRGIVYHRSCNDIDVPCSKLKIDYFCQGSWRLGADGQVGVCEKFVGTNQKFRVRLFGTGFDARGKSASLLIASGRMGVAKTIDLGNEEVVDFELPATSKGPALVNFKMVWREGLEKKSVESVFVIHGTSVDWTPMDQPHMIDRKGVKSSADFAKPVLSDLLEVVSYDAQNRVIGRANSKDKPVNMSFKSVSQICAYAWSRSSMDLTWFCIGPDGSEIRSVVYDGES